MGIPNPTSQVWNPSYTILYAAHQPSGTLSCCDGLFLNCVTQNENQCLMSKIRIDREALVVCSFFYQTWVFFLLYCYQWICKSVWLKLHLFKLKSAFFIFRIRWAWGNQRLDGVFLILSVIITQFSQCMLESSVSLPQVIKAGISELFDPWIHCMKLFLLCEVTRSLTRLR